MNVSLRAEIEGGGQNKRDGSQRQSRIGFLSCMYSSILNEKRTDSSNYCVLLCYNL